MSELNSERREFKLSLNDGYSIRGVFNISLKGLIKIAEHVGVVFDLKNRKLYCQQDIYNLDDNIELAKKSIKAWSSEKDRSEEFMKLLIENKTLAITIKQIPEVQAELQSIVFTLEDEERPDIEEE